MLAIKEGELWRQQPLTDWWPQWSAEDSETLRGYLMHSNTRWSRNVPSFMITPQGQVNMSWGGAGRVPLLVVDQLRGDDDDIEPPQHPECTYTALKRVWLRNLTVIARSLPRADIDWGHLHDYGKALRLSVVSACNIMHSPHPRNYHTRVAMWELAQEPQPAPLTAEQGAFKAHREKRIREAQKRHQSLEAHWRRTMRNFQRRAQEAEDWELTRYLETTDDTAGPAATKRPCVNPAGRATETVPQGDKACHGNLRALTHREERERDAMVRYSIEDTRQSQEAPCTQQKAEEGEQESATTAVNVNKENAAQAAPAATLRGEGEAPAPGTTKEAAGQAGTGTKETKPTQVLRLRAAGLRVEEVLPRSEVMTPRGKGSTWATSRRREMEPQTPSATDEATDRADTSTKETKPFFFFGKQFHYPLHGEKTRIGPEAAAGPVSNSREEHPNRCWPTLRFQSGPGSSAIRAASGHAEHDPRTAALPTPTPLHPLDSLPRPVPGCLPPPAPLIAPRSGPSPSPLQC